ncbi:unnamed protein product [Thelazia callipaeda]|uniref:Ribonuclease H-like domain-containing protein n=1 Tax=Thelazia callipaeda TaxID=103827 RepID=A0A0N5CWT3_THECL|nr:unnamed protein product [Thelazia callipaeda]
MIVYTYTKKSTEQQSEETVESPVMDRLAKNLAGAFVKSLLPDLDSSSKTIQELPDVRRSPATYRQSLLPPPNNLFSSQYQYANPYEQPLLNNIYPTGYATLPAQMQMAIAHQNMPLSHLQMPQAYPVSSWSSNPFEALNAIRQQNPNLNTEYQPLAMSAQVMPNKIFTSSFPLTINKFHEFHQNHEQNLARYDEENPEHFDYQHHYTQIKNRRNIPKYSTKTRKTREFVEQIPATSFDSIMNTNDYVKRRHETNSGAVNEFDPKYQYDQQTGGHVLLTAKNNDFVRRFSARDQLNHELPTDDSYEEATNNDEMLKNFFKEVYRIDVHKNGAELNNSERNILHNLKHYLTSKAYEKALSEGVFETMADFKNTLESAYSRNFGKYDEEEAFQTCDKCIPINFGKLKGTWTQVYGNPSIVQKTFSTLLSLHAVSLKSNMITSFSPTKRKTSCVGLQCIVLPDVLQSSSMRMFSRDDSRLHELFEMTGTMKSDGSELEWDLTGLNMRMCAVFYGPKRSKKYNYVIFVETTGPSKCVSYHVYTRSSKLFHQKYSESVANFMKKEAQRGNALPVADLPKPHLCEINNDNIT